MFLARREPLIGMMTSSVPVRGEDQLILVLTLLCWIVHIQVTHRWPLRPAPCVPGL